MFNVISSAPSHADSNVVEATAGPGGSPLAGRSEDTSGSSGPAGRSGGARRLFGDMLASAFGTATRPKVAGTSGNGLPVPALIEEEIGAGVRLITAEGGGRPGEEALFALAISQGLDPSVVASVLWPMGINPLGTSGATPGSGDGGQADSALPVGPDESLAGLLASVNPGQSELARSDAAPAGVVIPGWLPGVGDPAMTPAAEATMQAAVAGAIGSAATALGNGMTTEADIVSGSVTSALFAAELGAASGAGLVGQPGSSVAGVTSSLGAAPAAGLVGQPGSSVAGVTSSLGAAPAAGLVSQPGSSVAGVISSLGAAAAQLAGSRSIGLVGSEGAERSGSAAFNASAALSVAMTSAAGASSHPGAEPQQRPTRLADLQLQVQSVSGTGSAGGTLASLANTASAAVLPAHWVLTGGGLAPAGVGRAAAVTPFGSDAETVEGVDVPGGVGSEGSGPVTDAGARTHVGARQSQAAADPIDLTGDARNAINGGDSESGSEELARKLAEGIAQRVLAAVASNNWKLQIDLKPAHLGHVSIEMTMHQGQLDAVFDASQASSRALISEGLDRLRQDLQRAGMNVAHLGLNFGSGARSGGNSTPRGREDGQSEVVGGAIDEVASVALSQRPQAAPGDGLDVLV